MTISRDDLLKIRRLYGLTQYDVATAIGVTQTCVYKIEKGHMSMSEKLTDRFIKHFNLTPEKMAFIRGTVEMLDSERQAVMQVGRR